MSKLSAVDSAKADLSDIVIRHYVDLAKVSLALGRGETLSDDLLKRTVYNDYASIRARLVAAHKVFDLTKGKVAGCYVSDGRISRTARARAASRFSRASRRSLGTERRWRVIAS